MRNNEESANRIELMQGTLDMLILRTLVLGPLTGTKSPGTSSAPRMTCCRLSMGRFTRRSIAWSAKAGSRRGGKCPKTGSASSNITDSRRLAKSSLPRSAQNGRCSWPPSDG